jgi:hypothetical protein
VGVILSPDHQNQLLNQEGVVSDPINSRNTKTFSCDGMFLSSNFHDGGDQWLQRKAVICFRPNQ